MDEVKVTKRIFKIMGIAGFILTVVAVLLSALNFFGMFALLPGFMGVIFCFVSIFNLKKYDESFSFLIQKAGILTGIVGIVLSGFQFYQYGQILAIGGMLNYAVKETVKETIKEEVKNKIKEKIAPSTVDAPPIESEPVAEPNSIEKTIPSEDYFFITVDRLRIRSTPDLNGETLGHLDFGTRVVNLKEQSDHEDEIVIDGEKRNEPWRKISFRKDDYIDPIIGWIYGGGLVRPANEYYEMNDSKYLKTINGKPLQELTQMLEIGIHNVDDYIGLITYDENFNKNGKFYLKGVGEPMKDLGGYRELFYHKGEFKYGKINGMYEQHRIGYETIDHTRIKFDNGKCVWFLMTRHDEGDEYIHEESNPKDCSFDYIERGLKER